MAKTAVALRFGGLAPSIRDQVIEQGLTADHTKLGFMQRMADAIMLLSVQDILTDAMTKKARQRLCDAVADICTTADD